MRMSKLLGRRLKEVPRDAQSPSHIFLIRGGYIRPVCAGIYSLLPIARRVIRKIEQIIREEMDRIDGQEVLMPVAQPAELWEESGRYQVIGAELLRFRDRNDKAMVLAMTHEEATTLLVRTEANSYKQLPFMVYQLQTKYRDEARPRAGLIRVREFTMKDGYSFHESNECLAAYYERVYEAYVRIFARLGMTDTVAIQSDSGMMGGSVSHEFMAVAECGEDTLFLSPDHSSYKANRDIATTGLTFTKQDALPLEKVHTPGRKSIEEVSTFLGVTPAQTGKAVFYRDSDERLVFVMIRGDLEVNEVKLRNFLKSPQLDLAGDEQIRAAGAVPGYASPMGVDGRKIRIVIDPSAAGSSNLVVGANEEEYHCRNFNFDRDMDPATVSIVDIATAREGDPCPVTGEPLEAARGIEIGNIFQLGTKYSAAMNANFLDQNGKSHPMVMGCYGIGVGRSMAAIVEQCHDKYGPVWPLAVAPWEVHIVALNYNRDEIRDAADLLYRQLTDLGIETVLDDRNEKAGFAFADADLMGVPYRLILSPKTLESGEIEFKTRDGARHEKLPLADIVPFVQTTIEQARRDSRLPS